RIGNYLNRFHEITDRDDPVQREHGLDAAKRLLHRKFVIRPDEIPESYFDNQRRLAREQRHGDIEITQDMQGQLTEVIIADQRSSLDKWVDYLSSPDAPYSDGLKYYTLRSVLGMGAYDKEKHAFPTRTKGTVSPFPDLNREALAYVLDAIDKKYKGYDIDLSHLEETDAKEFEKLLASENFARLYVWAIEKVTPATPEQLEATNGEWRKYSQNSDPLPLVQSLQGHGTGWCTAGESTAEAQLQTGDFYVYYSLDSKGEPTIPRAAIRMGQDRIAEVRGISAEQNLDGGVVPIVEKKLKEFPDGPLYQKRANDMRLLTGIEHHAQEGQDLTSQELEFLYEIDSPIEGFGYQKDPRIQELRVQRNPVADMPIVFECEPSQIAHSAKEINEHTKAYVGELAPGIFNQLQRFNIEHVYTSFPEGRIRFDSVTIGGKDRSQLQRELRESGMNVSQDAEFMTRSRDFVTSEAPHDIGLVRLKVGDLGLPDEYSTTDKIFKRAIELGLELCPAEVGPNYRLQYRDQPMNEWVFIGMKSITDSDGRPDVFRLGHDAGGLWLVDFWAFPVYGWGPENEFVFSLPASGSA
ncbi:MAG: hypothetical protein COU25_01200, partial [Candidatus Levybacteria bacterium CG10_big_fil_rev_8_21_14_0_10_35_13]